MTEPLDIRTRRVLDHLASGILDADEIGNLIRDLIHEYRLRVDVGTIRKAEFDAHAPRRQTQQRREQQ